MLALESNIAIITPLNSQNGVENIPFCRYFAKFKVKRELLSFMEVSLELYNPDDNREPIQCPTGTDIKQCDIRIYNTGWDSDDYYISSGDCHKKTGFFNVRWECNNEVEYSVGGSSEKKIRLMPGEKIYQWKSSDIEINNAVITKRILRHTGSGADKFAGQKVQGSVGCTFDSSSFDKIYDQEHNVVAKGQETLSSGECYAVTSFNERRVCGNTCDQCATDSDCANQYPKQVNYGNRLLGATCSIGQMILYGCEPMGIDVCIEKELLPDGTEKCIKKEEKKSCEITKRITSGIECCSSDDCRGVGDFYCEWTSDTTSICKKKAQCSKDKDCGTIDKCDSARKELIVPYCDSEKQCSEKVLKKVECCKDSDCQGGFYCNSNYQCKETPTGSMYERNSKRTSTNKDSPSGITGNVVKKTSNSSSMTGIIIGILILLCIGGAIYYFKSKSTTDDSVEDLGNKNSGKFCENCGAQLTDDDKFCTGCGTKV